MLDKLERIKKQAEAAITHMQQVEEVQDLRVKLLGRKGELTAILRGIKDLSNEEKAKVGKRSNEVKKDIESLLDAKLEELKTQALDAKLQAEKMDVTLPGRSLVYGAKHPLTIVTDDVKRIFLGMGFTVTEGPEIELDYYNFEALNLPKNHPARDMQDSFYINEQMLLRTQTSPVQVRTMEKMTPNLPVKIIAPGKVYRKDDDATHSPMFHQIEGLMLDEKISFADLKGILMLFVQKIFGEDVKTRYRPSYFPFTEPSVEMDISCVHCKGAGCRVCKGTGWLEILGAGMVNPKVLVYGGYDPEKVTGFAFGMGVERVAMLRYGINDLRLFYDNDKRFLQQF